MDVVERRDPHGFTLPVAAGTGSASARLSTRTATSERPAPGCSAGRPPASHLSTPHPPTGRDTVAARSARFAPISCRFSAGRAGLVPPPAPSAGSGERRRARRRRRRRGPAHTTSSAGHPSRRTRSGSARSRRRRCARSPRTAPPRARTSSSVNVVDDRLVGPLEERVHDLDLLGAGAEADQSVDEPLQPVLLLDDVRRVELAEEVRLVVDDERARPVGVEHVQAAVQQDAVVLEGERHLGARARQ